MTPPKCPACHTRIRRNDRPLCNRCLRQVGPGVLDRWFAATRTDHHSVRVIGIVNTMILNATAYEQIRATGKRPFWDHRAQRWCDPVDRAATIIWNMTRTHRFYEDPEHDAAVIERTAAELFPTEER